MMTGPFLEFEDVSVRYMGREVLSNINLTFEPGLVHMIVGPNGGGKTTLLRALLGQAPFTGTIRSSMPSPVVGYAPQSLDIDRNLPMNVSDVLTALVFKRPVFLPRSASMRAQIAEMLEQLGFAGKEKLLFGELSGGERQRVLLAQALTPEPDLMILDEASANMDIAGVEITEHLVAQAAAAGKTVLWVNHDLTQVARLGDTVTAINLAVSFTGLPRDYVQHAFGREVLV